MLVLRNRPPCVDEMTKLCSDSVKLTSYNPHTFILSWLKVTFFTLLGNCCFEGRTRSAHDTRRPCETLQIQLPSSFGSEPCRDGWEATDWTRDGELWFYPGECHDGKWHTNDHCKHQLKIAVVSVTFKPFKANSPDLADINNIQCFNCNTHIYTLIYSYMYMSMCVYIGITI